MLKVIKRDFKCPHCENVFEITERVAINVTLDPGLKNKVLKGKIFRHTCPNCQKELVILNNCMYHDLDKRFMVYFMVDSPSREFPIPIGENGMGDFGEHYALRLESDYNSFRERVRILDTGFNDQVFEIARAVLLKELKKQMPEAQGLYFLGTPEGEIRFQVISGGKAVRSVDVNLDLYDKVEKIFDKFPEAHTKINALRRIDAQWLEESGILERVEKILSAGEGRE